MSILSSVAEVLDAINPIERIAILKQLGGAVRDLEVAASPLDKIAASRSVAILLGSLGEDVGGDLDEPGAGTEDDGLSDDPASENYRYRDTGYIPDSRKEQAASMIRDARNSGQRVRASDIDWNAIEQNPRAAAELITKSNLFGKTDWDSLKADGMDPAAGFLIEKVYASIGPEPTVALPAATAKSLRGAGADTELLERLVEGASSEALARTRKDYARGLESIRDRLEKCRIMDDVLAVIAEIRDELLGVNLTAEQTAVVDALQDQYLAKRGLAKAAQAEKDVVAAKWNRAQRDVSVLRVEQEKRQRRGWKPDPELTRKIAELEPLEETAKEEFWAFVKAHPELETLKREHANGWTSYENELEWAAREVYEKIRAIRREAQYFNVLSNPVTRAWLTFGERFLRLLEYRSGRGSGAFGSHVTSARMGKIKDWSWAEKDKPTEVPGKKPTKESINFQLRVAESYTRRGGKAVPVNSTLALKEIAGFRDVQSGNWVLRDPASAKFHVEQTAAAMSDMADMLGIEMKYLGLGGRLGMAFGARGTGGKGAPRAHYEPVERVINLTKMGGGGSLGHELLHAIDNILPSIANGTAGAKLEFASESPQLMPEGPMRDAFAKLNIAMTVGTRRLYETIKIAPGDKKLAQHNIDGMYSSPIGQAIKAAGNAEAAVLAVEKRFAGRTDKRSLKNRKRWRALAAAYFSPDDVEYVSLPVGQPVSNFFAEAQILDAGATNKYWSTVPELAARAFQSFLEDKMVSQDRQNDYLSVYAENKFHIDPLTGTEWKPYPEGEERTRINAAFEELFKVLRNERVFEKASENTALLDAIFSISSPASF